MAQAKQIVFRPGQKVVSNKTGIAGKVIRVRDTSVGQFVDVNFGDKKTPWMRAVRPSQLARA